VGDWLDAGFGAMGDIVQITFQVTPLGISDFSAGFTGLSNITMTPIPEPATVALLGIGGMAALIRRKK
jgi:hypothetical protein